MEDWLQIAIIAGVIVFVLLIIIIVIAIKSNSSNIGDCVWTDKKRTIFGLPISFTRYILTEKKLITRTGFFNLQEDEFDLYRVKDKKLNLSLGERIFNCGTIILHIKDKDTPVKTLKSIKNVREVQNKLDELIEAERIKYSVKGRDMVGYDDCSCATDTDDES